MVLEWSNRSFTVDKEIFFQPASAVAGLASLGECAMVRIAVAVAALIERNAGVARLAVLTRCVTFGASHGSMQPGQGITRLGMIELAKRERLPVFGIVALLAAGAKSSVVRILVTGGASGRETEVGPAEIFKLDSRTLNGRDPPGRVAAATFQMSVLAFERISGLLMIESLEVPLDEREVLAVMVGVTACTLFAGSGLHAVGRVQAATSVEPPRDFSMAVKAAKRRSSAQFVAGSAVRRPIQRLVGASQRARRNLRARLEKAKEKQRHANRNLQDNQSTQVDCGEETPRTTSSFFLYRQVDSHQCSSRDNLCEHVRCQA